MINYSILLYSNGLLFYSIFNIFTNRFELLVSKLNNIAQPFSA